ncbi:efflux RND transporter periplasmic adaptor subunit [Ideonella livida]|uniref:Efflux RND transporter periplasmic adaptor subunit n=1 Tax=Ideonella livida TaxID=2707176 RepID=A0A7C9TGX5_9BURK|nr:efflux RND transporter periplasmic adaptor subunit [Ideonella livida]NDY89978.1 efflux RND transporter periplasmic adaptor subunit [Ideonella livida]
MSLSALFARRRMRLVPTCRALGTALAVTMGLSACQPAGPAAAGASPGAGAAAPAPAPAALALQPADVVRAERLTLREEAQYSGSLRAARTAWVKSRAAGELLMLDVREGQAVSAGQVVARLDPADLDWRLRQAEQQAEVARAQLEIAERALANNRGLVGQGFISATALETTVANAQAARASLQAAQAGVELARRARAEAELRSPLGGHVAQRLAQPGERVAADTRLLEIVDLGSLELEVALPAAEAVLLRPGQTGEAQVEGLETPLAARLLRLSPAASTASRTLNAYFALPSHPALRQGLFLQLRLPRVAREVLAVPADALRQDQGETVVFRLEGDTLRRQPVRVGARGQGADGLWRVEVLDGLAPGQSLVAGRAGPVRAGQLVVPPAADAASH